MDDEQVVVAGDQGNRAGAAEIDVGLVDDDHGVRVGGDDALDGVEG